MRISKKLISILLAALMAVSMMPFSAITAFALADQTGNCGANGSNATYLLQDTDSDGYYDKLTIKGSGAMADYTSYTEVPWIRTGTTYTHKFINDITINSGITRIGNYAFYNCKASNGVSIPNTVTSIGNRALYGCQMTSINIPSSVTSIGNQAFAACKKMTSVTVPDSVTSMGTSVFSMCSILETAILPKNLTSLGDSAFSSCYALKNVTLPDNLTNLPELTFISCSSLENVTIPSGVVNINASAFRNCTSLQDIAIPSNVTSIGDTVFNGCSSLSTVTFERPSDSQTLSVGSDAFTDSPATVAYSGSSDLSLCDGNTALAEGATLSDYNGKTLNWGVPAVITGVAQIGETVYETLEEAIAAAQNGDTITLLDDVTGNFTIPAGKNVSLDLNGHTITTSSTSTPVITNRGTLNVYGGTLVNNGLYFPEWLGDGGVAVMNYGVATVNVTTNKGAIVNRSTASTTPNLTIAGGTYAGNPLALSSENNSYTVINDGNFTGEAAFVRANSGATIEVNDGNFACLGTESESNWIVNGGNVNAITVDGGSEDISITVTGGEIKELPSTSAVNNSTNVSVEVSGGSFDSVVPTEYCANGYVPVTEPDANGKYTVETNTAAIDEVSITTADEIDVNLYLGETGEEATVEYTFNTTPDIQQDTQGTKVVDFDSLPEVAGKRKLTIRVAPAQIRDNIDIVIKNAQGGVLRSYENYSVAEYCDQLAKGNYSENIKTLAKSVLDYGKAAANFFGYNESAFTNQAVNFNNFEFDTTGWTAVADNITIDEVRYVATSVPSLRFKVDMTEADAERYTVETDKGYKAEFVKVGEDVILQVTGIPASKLGETITVSVKDAQEDVIATIQYTPIIYAYNASKANNPELARLGETIGQYSAAAKAVFA